MAKSALNLKDNSKSLVAKLTIQAPLVHIYPFSRLVNAPAAKWEKLIADLEEKERIVYLYYQPMREAIIKFASKGWKDRDKIYAEMSDRAKDVIHATTQDPVKDNRRCFTCFEEAFQSDIKEFKASLLRVPQVKGTFFSGIILKGLPHMIVVDHKDRERFVYLYPSSWKDHELDSYMELLTVIVESQFGASAKDLWCMGLKSGKTIPRPKSKVKTRKACGEAAKHLKKLIDADLLKWPG